MVKAEMKAEASRTAPTLAISTYRNIFVSLIYFRYTPHQLAQATVCAILKYFYTTKIPAIFVVVVNGGNDYESISANIDIIHLSLSN